MNTNFQDLDVVVTGATGELGRAVLHQLLERGATCHLPCRRADRLESGARVRVAEGVDLSDEESVRRYYDGLPAVWASIHCVGAFASAPIVETSLAELQRMFAVNAASSFLCCREAVRRMAGRAGRIVNVAAMPALEARRAAFAVAYGMSKAAVGALTQALAQELAGSSILVNAVAPGLIDTPANRAALPDADASRWPTPDEIARAIVYLAGPENACVNGAVVPAIGRA